MNESNTKKTADTRPGSAHPGVSSEKKPRRIYRVGTTLTDQDPNAPPPPPPPRASNPAQAKPAPEATPIKLTQPSAQGPRGQAPPQEDGGAIVAKTLGPQLGSDPGYGAAMKIDERKLAVLNEYTGSALGYFAFRAENDNVRFWQHTVGWELASSQAMGGLARTHILKAIMASSGATMTDVANRPNLLARNVWNRSWKEDAARKGQTVVQE